MGDVIRLPKEAFWSRQQLQKMTRERLKQCGSFSVEIHSTIDDFSFNFLPALCSAVAVGNNKEIMMSLECTSHPDQLFINTIFMTLWKETRSNIWWKLVFLKGLEQTMFCGTLGNRSGRLSSGKLWANINEAFKLEHGGTLEVFTELLYESWTSYC